MDEVKPAARLPTVEHREPCESRGSRTVLGAPGGEIPPGDLSFVRCAATQQIGSDRSNSGHAVDIATTQMTRFGHRGAHSGLPTPHANTVRSISQ